MPGSSITVCRATRKTIAHAAPGMATNVVARDAKTEWTRKGAAARAKSVEPSTNSQPGEST